MAGPITWQNVGQANFGDAAGFMQMSSQNANQAINSAFKRTSEQEAKVKAGKTNALANQIYGITDAETLRAFQSKIDMEDMSIDSNVVNDAILRQGDIISRRAMDASNIAENNQQIAASKAGITLNQEQLALAQNKEKFDQDVWQKEFERNKANDALSNKALGVQIKAGELKLAEDERSKRLDEYTGKIIQDAAGGKPVEKSLMELSNGNARDMIELNNRVIAAQTSLFNVSPVVREEINRGLAKLDANSNKIAQSLEAAEAKFVRENPTVPTEALDITAQLEEKGINSHNKVVDDFVTKLKEFDPDAATAFYTQGWVDSTSNMGAKKLIAQVSSKDSVLNRAYREGLGSSATPDSVIDPALLRMALDAVNPSGNGYFDGIDSVELAKAAVALQEQRLTAQQYYANKEKALKPLRDQLKKVETDKRIYVSQEEARARKRMGNAVQQFATGSADGEFNTNINRNLGTGAAEAAQEFLPENFQ